MMDWKSMAFGWHPIPHLRWNSSDLCVSTVKPGHGGWKNHLEKWWSSSVGIMTFPYIYIIIYILWKITKMFETTNQYWLLVTLTPLPHQLRPTARALKFPPRARAEWHRRPACNVGSWWWKRWSSDINGHFRILNWRYLPYIRPIFQA